MVIDSCMKKTAVFVVFILALLISATFTIGMGNSAPSYPVPTGPLTPPVISLKSPTSTTYVSKFVPLEFSMNGNWDGYVNRCSVEISIDGGDRYVIYYLRFRVNEVAQNFSVTLGPLSEGIHQLQIFATVGGIYRTGPNFTALEVNDFTSQASVYFTVNTANQAQISILSPLNETYNVDKMIPLEFTIDRTESIVSMGYTVDEQANVTVPRNTTLYGPISDGMHTLKVYSLFSDILPVSSTVNFTVDTTAPNVAVLSLQNKLYNSSKIPLVFTVNESTSLITYNMDGKVYTIDGNTTLTGLQNVDHKLIVYATDEAGNVGVSETIDFNVQVLLSPQTALPIIPPMIVVLVGGLSLMIIIRKRNRASVNKH